jgi:hypothetical protein
MSEANKKARRPAGYKPFWEGDEEEEQKETKPSRFSGLMDRIIGNKTAAEIATEQAEELKKKKNGI